MHAPKAWHVRTWKSGRVLRSSLRSTCRSAAHSAAETLALWQVRWCASPKMHVARELDRDVLPSDAARTVKPGHGNEEGRAHAWCPRPSYIHTTVALLQYFETRVGVWRTSRARLQSLEARRARRLSRSRDLILSLSRSKYNLRGHVHPSERTRKPECLLRGKTPLFFCHYALETPEVAPPPSPAVLGM